MISIRAVLSVCAAYKYKMKQLDADSAFLNSELKDRVYMKTTFGINNAMEHKSQLNKAMYNLIQAASAWNKAIYHVFLETILKAVARISASTLSEAELQ